MAEIVKDEGPPDGGGESKKGRKVPEDVPDLTIIDPKTDKPKSEGRTPPATGPENVPDLGKIDPKTDKLKSKN
jgi:hypothetical protein